MEERAFEWVTPAAAWFRSGMHCEYYNCYKAETKQAKLDKTAPHPLHLPLHLACSSTALQSEAIKVSSCSSGIEGQARTAYFLVAPSRAVS
jgi:hypothetical protein